MAFGPFHEIPGAWVVLMSNGTYKQSKVYRRDKMLFAGNGSSFVRLYKHGTSNPKLIWDEIDLAGAKHKVGEMNKLELV